MEDGLFPKKPNSMIKLRLIVSKSIKKGSKSKKKKESYVRSKIRTKKSPLKGTTLTSM